MSKTKYQSDETKTRKGWKLWNEQEKLLFYQLEPKLKQNYKEYKKYFPERTYSQIKSFFHNYYRKNPYTLQRLKDKQANNDLVPSQLSNSPNQFQEQPIITQKLENTSNLIDTVDNLSYNTIIGRVARILETKE